MLRKIEGAGEGGNREWDGWIASHLFCEHEFEQILKDGQGQGIWCAAVYRVAKSGHDLATEEQFKPLSLNLDRSKHFAY